MNNKRVIVGISGGVDSSVSALLLKSAGFSVQGIFMQNWTNNSSNIKCTSEQDFLDAEKVCDQIDIPLHKANFATDYWEKVFSKFLSDHEQGLTPNPDILCNKEIKFRAFLDYCLDVGADYVATGHYVRSPSLHGKTKLLRGLDSTKDQSYFLHQVSGKDLERSVFPLGELTKKQVRQIASDNNLVNANRKDSVGICFIGKNKHNEFLNHFFGKNPGAILDEDGKKIGNHNGLMYFTLGQRQGIGIGGIKGKQQDSWYVAHKDLHSNDLTVVQGEKHSLLYSSGCYLEELHLINNEGFEHLNCEVQIRYQSKAVSSIVKKINNSYKIEFSHPQLAVTPGQSAVIYVGDECIGGGVITERISEKYFDWADKRGYNYRTYE